MSASATGRIAAIGSLGNASATRTIDASGLVVAPGFIDLHPHSDLVLVLRHADGRGKRLDQRHLPYDVEEDVRKVMKLPWVAVASDGSLDDFRPWLALGPWPAKGDENWLRENGGGSGEVEPSQWSQRGRDPV